MEERVGELTLVVLASESPRRRALMADLLGPEGEMFVSAPADVDERAAMEGLPAEEAVQAAAVAKLRVGVAQSPPGATVVAADTVVIGPAGEVLGKPVDRSDGEQMLKAIRGSTIQVLTGVASHRGGVERVEAVSTQLELTDITDAEIADYLSTDIPWDKAGALELQGASARFVEDTVGCWTNVVGLPMCVVQRHLLDGPHGCTCRAGLDAG